MDDGLLTMSSATINEMGVPIPKEKHYLKKQHAGRKNRGCAAKPRENILCYYQLHLEQKKRTAKHRKTENCQRGVAGRSGRCLNCHRPDWTADHICIHFAS